MRYSKKSGFTLVELSISALIVSLIATVLIYVFRSNLQTLKWGQKHMSFNQHIQLVIKQIFTDLKDVNPVITMDAGGHIWIQGEKNGEIRRNHVDIYRASSEEQNDTISILLTDFHERNRRDLITYYIDVLGQLIRSFQDYDGNSENQVIAKRASKLKIGSDPYDNRQITLSLVITNDDDLSMSEKIDFAVRLQTDLVGVRLHEQHD